MPLSSGPMMHTLADSSAAGFLPVFILLVIAVVFGLTNVGLPTLVMKLFGHGRQGAVKGGSYETGMNPFHTARRRFNIRFYILAMTFLVFDVEIVFLYPWATTFPSLAEGHALSFQFLARMVFFIGTSVVAYAYAWRKGVFRYD